MITFGTGCTGVVVGPRRTAAWRVLDSQFYGVAQRRERVVVIASPHKRVRYLGTKRVPIEGDFYALAAKVLFESEGVRRHTPPRQEKEEDIASHLGSSPEGSGPRTDYERMTFIPTHDVSPCLQERGHKGADSDCTQTYVVHGFDKGRGEYTGEEMAGTLRCNEGKREGVNNGKADNKCVSTPTGVRRLTPVECERIQGFPDDWTRFGIEESGRTVQQKDSPRYRQLGNAVTTNVAAWIANRIKKYGY